MTILSYKRIRSSYHWKILNFLFDAGGSVSQISKSLGIRTPHVSLALTQLRNSGFVHRDDSIGLRGAMHKITDLGRKRLEEDSIALLQNHLSEIDDSYDAIVLDSRGSNLVLCYMKNPPDSLICLPNNPYEDNIAGTDYSIGNTGVRWATIKRNTKQWYSLEDFSKVSNPPVQTNSTLEDWSMNKSYVCLVRANLVEENIPWNVTPGSWFNSPKLSSKSLPEIIDYGDFKIGTVSDISEEVYWSDSLHAHLTSELDATLLTSIFSPNAILLISDSSSNISSQIPVGCLKDWLMTKHRRMKKERLEEKYQLIANSLISGKVEKISVSLMREITRDFGNATWCESIPMQINIYNVAEEATKSLVRYIDKTLLRDFVLQWVWSNTNNQNFLNSISRSRNCKLILTKGRDFVDILSSKGLIKSTDKLAVVEFYLSKSHQILLDLDQIQQVNSHEIHESIPKDAAELIKSYSEDEIDKSFFSHLETDLENRRNVWEAIHLFPKGNENFANEHEITNPLASWIATPEEFRLSRWIRIKNMLPDGWADLLPLQQCDIKILIQSISQGTSKWQEQALNSILNCLENDDKEVLKLVKLIDDSKDSHWAATCFLLSSRKISNDFTKFFPQCLDIWLDAPLYTKRVIEYLLDYDDSSLFSKQEIIKKILQASMIHPRDSLLYNWGKYVDLLQNNIDISVEDSRDFMSVFPLNWWYSSSLDWLIKQLNTSSGRRWLSQNYIPWPAIIARVSGESCGPPGHKVSFERKIPKLNQILHIPIISDGMGKDSLLDLYDMISCYEDGKGFSDGRIHPMVGLLLTSYSEWPEITQNVFELGDQNVASLLFGIGYFNRLDFNSIS